MQVVRDGGGIGNRHPLVNILPHPFVEPPPAAQAQGRRPVDGDEHV
jgi:hypothetical protein